MAFSKLKNEYRTTSNLTECLRQHTVYCLYHDFDQILRSDLITVQCCNCGIDMKVEYEKVSSEMFCTKCIETNITKQHIKILYTRISAIRQKLLGTK